MPNNKIQKQSGITIIGGGASGLVAAIAAAEIVGGSRVTLIEKNDRVGRKLLATGNGRCNFSNRHCSYVDFNDSHDENGLFCKEALSIFGVPETLNFFEKIGVFPKEEEAGRLYPYSEQASAVQETLLAEVETLGVEILSRNPVKRIQRKEEGTGQSKEEADFQLTLDHDIVLTTKKVILASGGKAGIQYGSEGDGYPMALSFGHTIVKPIPALVPLLSDDAALTQLKGVRATGKVTLFKRKHPMGQEIGEIQFTGEGLSGICVFNLSGQIRHGEGEQNSLGMYLVEIDLFPELEEEILFQRLLLRKEYLKTKEKKDFFKGMIHQKLAPVILAKSGNKTTGPVEEWKVSHIKGLAQLLKHWVIPITGTKGWKEAQVTSGGVKPTEINGNTMESKFVKGLYFAGEIIDVDGKCGGYNLQWAWTSGFIAGHSAAKSLEEKSC